MPDGDSVLLKASEHGTVGEHAAQDLVTLRVAPATVEEFNVISIDLVSIACLSLTDVVFEFDSSFVNPNAAAVLSELPALRLKRANPNSDLPPLAVFGHADPVGDDEYNKQLSGRRARAVYGLLIHKAAIWEALIDSPFGGDDWNADGAVAKMRKTLGPGAPAKRHDLIESYMNLLCPSALSPEDFIGRGADAKLRGDVQGCSEFNPLRLLSTDENNGLPKEDRNALNLVNRRVVIYLFRPTSKANPELWPCPASTEGGAKCRRRFFADGDQRRQPGETRREHQPSTGPRDRLEDRTDDTFACRFYARMANSSPCERILKMYMIRLFDRSATPLPGAPWVLTDGVTTRAGFADPETAFLTVHDLHVPAQCTVKWNRPGAAEDSSSAPSLPDPNGRFEFEMNVFVDLPGSTDDQTTLARLHNLGYVGGATEEDDIREFQEDYQDHFPDLPLEPSGKLDSNTRTAIQRVNDGCDPVVKEPEEQDGQDQAPEETPSPQ
ncbi:MAG TPA: OmpA family protein [Bryobacteraceae bacterium]|nr:OmpA family protein [Bryobacteraceae bacterium]